MSTGDWLWEAGRSLGVTVEDPDGKRARTAAAKCGTVTSKVECGSRTLDADLERSWERTGAGWAGHRDADGVMRWTAFGAILAEAPLAAPGEPERPRVLRLVPPAESPVHVAEPEPGSFRTADGRQTGLYCARYPVWAVCRACGQGIRADSLFSSFAHDGTGRQDTEAGPAAFPGADRRAPR